MSTWKTHLWEFLYFYRLEVYLSMLNLPVSSCVNDAKIIDAILRLGWKDENLRLVNQAKPHFKMHFISDFLLPRTDKIKRYFRQGLIDETASSK